MRRAFFGLELSFAWVGAMPVVDEGLAERASAVAGTDELEGCWVVEEREGLGREGDML
jgi:hypothetical protein